MDLCLQRDYIPGDRWYCKRGHVYTLQHTA